MPIVRVAKLLALLGALLSLTGLSAYAQEASAEAVSAQGQAGDEQQPKASWWDSDVWSDSERGFSWYPPEKKRASKPKDDKKQDPKPAVAGKPKNLREIRDLAELQAEIKRIKETAIFDPTPDNVHRYLQAQEYVMSQSQLFADTARRVVWQNPDVDYTSKAPQAAYSVSNQRNRVTNRRYEVLKDIGRTHGLLYFFRSDCHFCEDMSPVMKAMESQYGIEVLPISLDGKPTRDFPQPRKDNGISRFVSRGEGIQTVPAVYLVSNDQKTVMLIGTGALAMDDVAERVRVLLTVKPGKDY